MSRSDDLEINRSIRRILVRHFVDLGRLAIRTVNGAVLVHGAQRIGGVDERLNGAIVDAMFTEIESLPRVRRVSVELDNWVQAGGRWHATADLRTGRTASAEAVVHDLPGT